jgi:hypothetical protein
MTRAFEVLPAQMGHSFQEPGPSAPSALAIGIAGPFGPKNRYAFLVENRYETRARIPDNFEIRPFGNSLKRESTCG